MVPFLLGIEVKLPHSSTEALLFGVVVYQLDGLTEMLDEFIGSELATRFESFTVRPVNDPKFEDEANRQHYSCVPLDRDDDLSTVDRFWHQVAFPASRALVESVSHYYTSPNLVVPRVPAGAWMGGQGKFAQWLIDYDPIGAQDRFHLNVYTH